MADTPMSTPRDRIEKLPRGRHGLSPQFVASHQRERLLEAMIEVVAQRGYSEAAVADVLESSGVSRKTFYEQFSSKEDCFLQAYDLLIDGLEASIARVVQDRRAPWHERVRAAMSSLLTGLSEYPDRARVGLIEVLAAGPRALERYDRAVRRFIPLLEEGRVESPYGQQLPHNLSEAVVGGISQVLYLRALTGDTASLPAALDELLYFALVPYLGHTRAARLTFGRSDVKPPEPLPDPGE